MIGDKYTINRNNSRIIVLPKMRKSEESKNLLGIIT